MVHNKYSYTKEKLMLAVRDLATMKGGINERLEGVFLSIHTLNDDDFPEELRSDWVLVKEGVLQARSNEHGLKKNDEEKQSAIAHMICNLEDKIDNYIER